ncbi:MAG: putative lipid II flippase FtsW [Eubacteriales bacterium]|nr:putative lipid II flippase FtsW [Eubacteriales bacterium]
MIARLAIGAKESGHGLLGIPARERGRVSRGLLLCTFALLAVGLVTLYAASFYNAQSASQDALAEVKGQLRGVALGLVLMCLAGRIDYRFWQRSAPALSLVALSTVLLVLVAIPGVGQRLNGSRRWLRLGPVSFQPSELAKYAMVLFLARALAMPSRDVTRLFTGLAPLFVVPGVFFFLILLQPNLSTAGSILIVAVLMVTLAGAKWSHLSLAGLAGAGLFAFYAWSEPYRRERLLSFRDPFAKLSDEGYQLAQSLIAFGSGGLFGCGIGQGRQKYGFLPYPESDFIFAIVGEDMGLFGCLAILALFGAFVFFGLRTALRCPDKFGSLLAGGISCMIGVQFVMNIAVVTGLMPTTGLPLPFFSAGGTSVAIILAAVGVLLSISREEGRPPAG